MNKSRRMKWTDYVAYMGDKDAYKVLDRKPQGKRPLWRSKPKMDHNEVGYEGVDWIHEVQVRDQWQALVNMIMNFWTL